MFIIVGREHEGLYKGLKARQEANGKDRVSLIGEAASAVKLAAFAPRRSDVPATAAFRSPTLSAR